MDVKFLSEAACIRTDCIIGYKGVVRQLMKNDMYNGAVIDTVVMTTSGLLELKFTPEEYCNLVREFSGKTPHLMYMTGGEVKPPKSCFPWDGANDFHRNFPGGGGNQMVCTCCFRSRVIPWTIRGNGEEVQRITSLAKAQFDEHIKNFVE